MPRSFQTREDSPYPFRLQAVPLPKRLRPHHPEAQKLNRVDGTRPSPAPIPPLSTPYINMLLELDSIPRAHNFLASVFTWLLLAGYIVLPGSFASLIKSPSIVNGAGIAGKFVLKAAQGAPLLWIAGTCCLLGATGMLRLGWRWKSNYIWIINRLIM